MDSVGLEVENVSMDMVNAEAPDDPMETEPLANEEQVL